MIKPDLLGSLPTLSQVETLPGGLARLTLEGGQTLEVKPDQRAALSPATDTPRALFLSDGPHAGAYILPEHLTGAVLDALAFPFTVQGFRVEAGRVSLYTIRQGAPLRHVHRLVCPTVHTLRESEDGAVIVTFPTHPQEVYEVPDDLRRALTLALTGEETSPGPVARLEALTELEGGALFLSLSTGHALTLTRTGAPRAVLLPVTAWGVPVIRTDWKNPAAYSITIPRPEDAATLARYFDQAQAEGRTG